MTTVLRSESGLPTGRDLDPAPTGTIIGCELDGTTLSFAVARNGRIVEVGHVDAPTPSAALSAGLRRAGHGGAAVVVAWMPPSGTGLIRSAPFPVVQPASRRAALDALSTRIAPGGSSCVRLGTARPDRRETPSVIGTAKPGEVAAVWRDAHDNRVRLILSPMVLAIDGVWLAIRRAGADLTVVDGGLPRLSRPLTCGGIDGLAAGLGALGADGHARLAAVLRGLSVADAEALSAVDHYVGDLCGQVRDSLAYWRREERIDVSVVHVHGAGATLPTIEARLAGVGITALAPPHLPQADAISAETLAVAFTSVQAALASPTDLVGFADLVAMARKSALARAAANTRRTFAVAGVATLAVGGVVVPVTTSQLERARSAAKVTSAARTVVRLRREETAWAYVNDGRSAWAAIGSTEPDWAKALDLILRSAPHEVAIQSLTIDGSGQAGSVGVTIQAHGTSPEAFKDLETWVAILDANPSVSKTFSTAARSRAETAGGGGTTFEIQFDITAGALVSPRPFPATPTAGAGR